MIRAFDLELLRGIGLSVVLAVIIYYCFTWFCYRWKTNIQLIKTLQDHWRPFLLIIGILIPVANSCYWIKAWTGFYTEIYTALLLVLVAMGGEVFIGIFEHMKLGERFPKPVWNGCFYFLRFALYTVLICFTYNNVVQQGVSQGELVLAVCYTAAVYMVLKFVHSFIFDDINFKSELIRNILQKIRTPGHIIVVVLTLMYAWTWTPIKAHEVVNVSKYLSVALAADIGIMIIESVFFFIFGYYFIKVKPIKISKLIQDLCRLTVYVVLVLTILSNAFNVNLSSLLVGSTVISVIIGLALQETMGNFVAGLFLDFAAPYRAGDYIEVGGLAGTVEKVDWRSTVLRLITGERNILPNSTVAKSNIKNYSVPTRMQARNVIVGVGYEHSPELVRRVLLQAVKAVPEALQTPTPSVWLMDFASSSMDYRVNFWIEDFSQGLSIESKVRESIWYHFAREKINIPFPITTVITNSEDKHAEREAVAEFLSRLDIMQELSPDFVKACAGLAKIKLYASREQIYPSPVLSEDDAFSVVKSGRLRMVMIAKTPTVSIKTDLSKHADSPDSENKSEQLQTVGLENNSNGTETELRAAKIIELHKGDIFSEKIADMDHFETIVTALEETETVNFSAAKLRQLKRLFPEEYDKVKKAAVH